MTAPDTGPAPEGGLTGQQTKVAIVATLALFVPLIIVLTILFPDFPLSDPFGGAVLAQVFLAFLFHDLKRPVEHSRLIWFFAVADLAALAIMLGVATIIQAMGWTESIFLEVTVGFGGTLLIVGVVQQWLFRIMIRRHDNARDEEEKT